MAMKGVNDREILPNDYGGVDGEVECRQTKTVTGRRGRLPVGYD